MSRNSKFARDLCAICEKICIACAIECEKHTDDKDCMKCADSCRKCAEECKK
ncbi:MAG: hypothetical protein K5777_07140 [Nitrosopumilus sp.]|nr:hypothetical protein [Nitrosopumilus sp.]